MPHGNDNVTCHYTHPFPLSSSYSPSKPYTKISLFYQVCHLLLNLIKILHIFPAFIYIGRDIIYLILFYYYQRFCFIRFYFSLYMMGHCTLYIKQKGSNKSIKQASSL